MFGRLVSGILNVLPRNVPTNALVRSSDVSAMVPSQSQWNFTSFRTKTKWFYMTKVRYNFPNPSEYKRVKKLGWAARMSTPTGRRILMRRILKGKHVLSH